MVSPLTTKTMGHHDGSETDEQPAHAVHARLKGVGRRLGGGGVRGQRAEVAARPGGHDHCGGSPRDDVRAHEDDVAQLQRGATGHVGLDELLHRQRLPRHRRLGDEQVSCGDYAAVGRDHVAGRQRHDVARDQLAQGDLLRRRGQRRRGRRYCCRGRPQHRGGVAHEAAQALGRPVRTAFLHEADARAQRHHDGDHDRRLGVRAEERQHRQGGEQQVERVEVAAPQAHPAGQRRFLLHVVGAVSGEPAGSFDGVEPCNRGVQPQQGRRRSVAGGGQHVGAEHPGYRVGRARTGRGAQRTEQRSALEMRLHPTPAQEGAEALGEKPAHRRGERVRISRSTAASRPIRAHRPRGRGCRTDQRGRRPAASCSMSTSSPSGRPSLWPQPRRDDARRLSLAERCATDRDLGHPQSLRAPAHAARPTRCRNASSSPAAAATSPAS